MKFCFYISRLFQIHIRWEYNCIINFRVWVVSINLGSIPIRCLLRQPVSIPSKSPYFTDYHLDIRQPFFRRILGVDPRHLVTDESMRTVICHKSKRKIERFNNNQLRNEMKFVRNTSSSSQREPLTFTQTADLRAAGYLADICSLKIDTRLSCHWCANCIGICHSSVVSYYLLHHRVHFHGGRMLCVTPLNREENNMWRQLD